MQVFLGTLIIMILCCLLMALGLIVTGRAMSPGCGMRTFGKAGCDSCPARAGKRCVNEDAHGLSDGSGPC